MSKLNLSDRFEQVDRVAFWKAIYSLNTNVHPTLKGSYPYTSYFNNPNGKTYGIINNYLEDGTAWPVKTDYYLPRS